MPQPTVHQRTMPRSPSPSRRKKTTGSSRAKIERKTDMTPIAMPVRQDRNEPQSAGSLSRFRNLLRTVDESLDKARRHRLGLDALLAPQQQVNTGPVRLKATKIVRGA